MLILVLVGWWTVFFIRRCLKTEPQADGEQQDQNNTSQLASQAHNESETPAAGSEQRSTKDEQRSSRASNISAPSSDECGAGTSQPEPDATSRQLSSSSHQLVDAEGLQQGQPASGAAGRADGAAGHKEAKDAAGSSTAGQEGPSVGTLAFFGDYLKDPTGEGCDVFLSHTGAQKRDIVQSIWASLRRYYPSMEVFLDEFSLQPGDRAMLEMKQKLEAAWVVVVMISKDFVEKAYPMEELHLLMKRHGSTAGNGGRVIPVYCGVDFGISEAWAKQAELQALADKLLGEVTVKLSVKEEEIVKEFRSHASTDYDCGKLLEQYAKDLKLLLTITGIRRDQVQSYDELRDRVIEVIAERLAGMNHLPRQVRAMPEQYVPNDKLHQELLQLLACGQDQHLVLLHGLADTGKSVQAKRAFNWFLERYPELPSCFVDLRRLCSAIDDAQHGDPKAIADELRTSMADQLAGWVPPNNVRPVVDAKRILHDAVAGRKVLIVVDNATPDGFQRLMRGPPQVLGNKATSILDAVKHGSSVLMTSRSSGSRDAVLKNFVRVPMAGMEPSHAHRFLKQHYLQHLEFMAADDMADAEDMTAAEEAKLADVVAVCGGLTCVLESAARYLASSPGWLTAPAADFLSSPDFPRALDTWLGKYDGCLRTPYADATAVAKDIAWLFNQGRPLEFVAWVYGTGGMLLWLLEYGWLDEAGWLSNGSLRPAPRPLPGSILHSAVVRMCQTKIDLDMRTPGAHERLKAPVDNAQALLRRPWAKYAGVWLTDGNFQGLVHEAMDHFGSSLRVFLLEGAMLPDHALQVPWSQELGYMGLGAGRQQGSPGSPPGSQVSVIFSGPEASSMEKVMVMVDNRAELTQLMFRWAVDQAPLAGNALDIRIVHALWVSSCSRLSKVELGNLNKLQKLCIWGCTQLGEVAGLERMTALQTLRVCGCSAKQVMQGLSDECAGSLQSISIQPCASCTMAACLQHSMLSNEPSGLVFRQPTAGLACLELHSGDTAEPSVLLLRQQTELTRLELQQGSALAGQLCLYSTGRVATEGEAMQAGCLLGTLRCMHLGDKSSNTGLESLLLYKPSVRQPKAHSLQVSGSQALEALTILTNLRTLSLASCSSVANLLPDPTSTSYLLQELSLDTCTVLQVLPDLSTATRLTKLELKDCSSLESLTLTSSLEQVQLELCSKLKQLEAAESTDGMKLCELRVHSCELLGSLPDFQIGFSSLVLLELQGCDTLAQVRLGPSLVRAHISSCNKLHTVHMHPAMPVVNPPSSQAGMAAVAALPAAAIAPATAAAAQGLWELRLQACPALRELPGLQEQRQLAFLTVQDCGALQHLPLSFGLRELNVSSCTSLTSIQCLAKQSSEPSADLSARAVDGDTVAAAALKVVEKVAPWLLDEQRFAHLREVIVTDCPLELRECPCSQHLPHPATYRFKLNGTLLTCPEQPADWEHRQLGQACPFH